MRGEKITAPIASAQRAFGLAGKRSIYTGRQGTSSDEKETLNQCAADRRYFINAAGNNKNSRDGRSIMLHK